MKKLLSFFVLGCAVVWLGAAESVPLQTRKLAQDALSTKPEISQAAIATLRASGKEGLQALLAEHADLLKQYSLGLPVQDAAKWERFKHAVDSVGQQKDCHASGLYWFDDLQKAKVEAARKGKAILSLRMLGKLNEEYSCANSRFFRTTLYPNAEVANYLRENFVLHWESVRPVPRITVDFGDGRKIERTVTGNSIHYVLHSDGTPIDALPGLYSAKRFLAGLAEARKAAEKYAGASQADRAAVLRSYHEQRLMAVSQQSATDLSLVNSDTPGLRITVVTNNGPAPDANRAMGMAFSKSGVEVPLARSLVATIHVGPEGSIEERMADPVWSKIAALHHPEAKLDADSTRLVMAKSPGAKAASRISVSKRLEESPVLRVLQNLERSIAEDTVRNEYVLHAEIHRWFIRGEGTSDITQLNRKVYADLFLTPENDPWLGLVPDDAFSALPNDGLVNSQLHRDRPPQVFGKQN